MINNFLLWPTAFGQLPLLIIILFGFLAMGFLTEILAFVAFLLVMYVLIGGAVVIAASFTGGIFSIIAWLLILGVFCFDVGYSQSKRRDFAHGLHLIVLATIFMVAYRHVFQMPVWKAIGATLITAVVYAVIGWAVAYLWKWRKFNRAANEEMFAKQAAWLQQHIAAALVTPEPDANIGPVNNVRQRVNQGADKRRSKLADGEPALTDPEIAALKALKGTTGSELGLMHIPEPLLRRWNRYRIEHRIASPKLTKCKAMFFSWMMGWPGLVVYEALQDLVEALGRALRNLFTWFYGKIAKALRRTQERLLGHRSDLLDLPEPEVEEPEQEQQFRPID